MYAIPVTAEARIAAAMRVVERTLRKGATRFRRMIGTQGGHTHAPVYWRPRDRLWCCFTHQLEDRYWCAYGIQDPTTSDNLSIAVEINPPLRGFRRQVAGLFVQDDVGRKYLAHTGRVGGGRKGIGKTAFLSSCAGPTFADVRWPDGLTSEVLVVAEVGSRRFIQQVAAFVHEVASFKTSSGMHETNFRRARGSTFAPEFEGKRDLRSRSPASESVCNHGIVVRHLMRRLEAKGLRVANDRARDLFVRDHRGVMQALFEVKTDILPGSLYTAVGQLMVNGASEKREPRRILVVPGKLSKSAQSILRRLNVEVLSYHWAGQVPVFPRLKKGAL